MKEFIQPILIVLMSMAISALVIVNSGQKSKFIDEKKSLNKQIEDQKKEADRDNKIQEKLFNELSAIKGKQNDMSSKISSITNRIIYATICTDADGVWLINDNYAGKTPSEFINSELRATSTTRPGK